MTRSNYSNNEVEDEKGKENEGISPSIREFDVQRQEKLVAHCKLAVATGDRITEIVDVTTKVVHEILTPRSTRLPGRWVEYSKLIAFAADDQTVELGRNHRGKRSCIWIELVDPRPPEFYHGWVWDRYATECSQDQADKRIEQHSNLYTR